MPAALTLSNLGRHHRSAIATAPATREATFGEIEQAIGRLAAPHLGDAGIALLSIARADDGTYAVVECAAPERAPAERLEQAAGAVTFGLDPVLLGARAGASVRVRFSANPWA